MASKPSSSRQSTKDGPRAYQRPFRGQQGRGQASTPRTAAEASSVPLLQCGKLNNFPFFKKKLVPDAKEKFGDLAKLINLVAYYVPPEIDRDAFDLTDDPHGLTLEHLKSLLKAQWLAIAAMEAKRTAFHGYLWKLLSEESIDLIQRGRLGRRRGPS